MSKLSDLLRYYRLEAGLTQEAVSRAIGMSRASYIQMENGNKEPSYSEMLKLSETFDIPVRAMFDDYRIDAKVTLGDKDHKKTIEKRPSIRIDVPQERVDKFKEVLLYILEKIGARHHVGETVIYKLLYFVDFDYYEKYEEQLMGAVYIKNHFGPTPVAFKKIVKDMQSSNELLPVNADYFKHKQKKYLPLRQPNLSLLSAREIKHIDDVINRLADMNAAQLSEYSHKDIPWVIADGLSPIKYEAVFYRTSETSVKDYEHPEL